MFQRQELRFLDTYLRLCEEPTEIAELHTYLQDTTALEECVTAFTSIWKTQTALVQLQKAFNNLSETLTNHSWSIPACRGFYCMLTLLAENLEAVKCFCWTQRTLCKHLSTFMKSCESQILFAGALLNYMSLCKTLSWIAKEQPASMSPYGTPTALTEILPAFKDITDTLTTSARPLL